MPSQFQSTVQPNGGTSDEPETQGLRSEDEILNEDFQDQSSDQPLMQVQGKDAQGQPITIVLTPDLEKKIISLVHDYETEVFATWRGNIREWMEAESFWKGIQYGFYDSETDMFRLPTQREMDAVGDSNDHFRYVTNIFHTFGWAIIAVLGQKVPKTVYMPSDFTNEADVVAARTAGDIIPYLERVNKRDLQHIRAAYYFFIHGIVATYTRYVVSGERFGYDEQEVIDPSAWGQMIDAVAPTNPTPYGLPPTSEAPNPLAPSPAASQEEPQLGQVPNLVVTKKVPRGQVLTTLHDGLELRLPPWCNEQADYPYLGLVNEIHVSSIRATYGTRAKHITGGFGESGSYDIWDRHARLMLIESIPTYFSVANKNLVTLKRYWLRPSAFYHPNLQDSERQKLLQLFPDGAYIAYASDDKLLDAKNESMDEHWVVEPAQDARGAFPPALGQPLISIQKRVNTMYNLIMEWVEYSAAGFGTFIDQNIIDVDALRKHPRSPGLMYPVDLAPGQNMGNSVWSSQPSAMPAEVFKHLGDTVEMGQQVSGAVPTVSGGTDMSLKPTTYLADREQALGKLFVPWQHLRRLWAKTSQLEIKQFAKFAPDDLKFSIPGQSNSPVNRLVQVENLQGNFDAYPDIDEQFPRLWYEQRSMFMQLLQLAANDPMIAEILGNTENYPYAKTMFGMPDLYVPGEDDRYKQQHEIAVLLQGQPMQIPNGLGGFATVPSVMPDWEDDDVEHETYCKKFLVSGEGLRAKTENNPGYLNVVAHAQAHDAARFQKQAHEAMQAAQAQAPAAAITGMTQPQKPPPKGSAPPAKSPAPKPQGMAPSTPQGGNVPGQ